MVNKKIFLVLGLFLLVAMCFITQASAQAGDASLIAHWKFDDASGTTATDSENDNDGALTNGPIWTTGIIGGALQFDGTDDYVAVPRALGFKSAQGTIAFWMKANSATAPTGDNEDLINIFQTGYQDYLNIRRDKYNGIFLGVDDDNNNANDAEDTKINFRSGQGKLADTNWHHIAITQAGSGPKVYIDGVDSTPSSGTGINSNYWTNHLSFSASTAGVWIGQGHWGKFPGTIDDVKIYNYALSADEISAEFNSIVRTPTDLTATVRSSSQIDLSWTASSGATAHRIYRSTPTAGAYAQIAAGTTITATTYSDTGLTAATNYYYKITAVNSAGAESAHSTAIRATTWASPCTDNDRDEYTLDEVNCRSSDRPDCNDNDASIYPGATEICDGKDNNCEGRADENFGSTTCGIGACQRTIQNCLGGQTQNCVPGQSTAETCGNGIDEDCDGIDQICSYIYPGPSGAYPPGCENGICIQTPAACLKSVSVYAPNASSPTDTSDSLQQDQSFIIATEVTTENVPCTDNTPRERWADAGVIYTDADGTTISETPCTWIANLPGRPIYLRTTELRHYFLCRTPKTNTDMTLKIMGSRKAGFTPRTGVTCTEQTNCYPNNQTQSITLVPSSVTGTNIAQGKSIISGLSSCLAPDNTAGYGSYSYLVDGNIATMLRSYSSNNCAYNGNLLPSAVVDLGAPYKISGLRVNTNLTNRPTVYNHNVPVNYTVYFSTDSTTWSSSVIISKTVAGITNPAVLHEEWLENQIPLADRPTARYVKLERQQMGSAFMVNEFEVYGALPAQDTTPPTVSFTDDVSLTAATSDIIEIGYSDDALLKKYSYVSTAAACVATMDTTAFLTYLDVFTLSDPTQNGKYICAYAEDASGNKAVAVSANPVNIISTAQPAFTVSSFACSKSGNFVNCDLTYNNQNTENVVVLFTAMGATGSALTYIDNAPAYTTATAQASSSGTLRGRFEAEPQGLDKVSFKAYRYSITDYSSTLSYSGGQAIANAQVAP